MSQQLAAARSSSIRSICFGVLVLLLLINQLGFSQARYLPTRADESRKEMLKAMLKEVSFALFFAMWPYFSRQFSSNFHSKILNKAYSQKILLEVFMFQLPKSLEFQLFQLKLSKLLKVLKALSLMKC